MTAGRRSYNDRAGRYTGGALAGYPRGDVGALYRIMTTATGGAGRGAGAILTGAGRRNRDKMRRNA